MKKILLLLCAFVSASWGASSSSAVESPRETFMRGVRLIEKNEKQAFDVIKIAAENGLPAAQYFLARIYKEGLLGVPQNDDEAILYYVLAADAGQRHALNWLDQNRHLYDYCDAFNRWFEDVTARERDATQCFPYVRWETEYFRTLTRISYLTKAERLRQEAYMAESIPKYFVKIHQAWIYYRCARGFGYKDSHGYIKQLGDDLAKSIVRMQGVSIKQVVPQGIPMEHAVIGLCPANGYFNPENVASLVHWSQNAFRKVTYFIPDGWTIHTNRAKGIAKPEIITRKNDANITNKVVAAFGLMGISKEAALRSIVYASDLEKDPVYQRVYAECLERYKNEDDFKSVCDSFSSQIVKSADPELINIAVNYLLCELPLFLASSEIFNVSYSYNVYHHYPEFIKLIKSPNQGFIEAVVDSSAHFSAKVTPLYVFLKWMKAKKEGR